MSFRLIGSAPSRSSLARSDADCEVKPPVMLAPALPPLSTMPSGYCLKSICGTVISWLVMPPSATAKCWSSVWPPRLTLAPRWAIWPVTDWNREAPEPVKPNWTSGAPVWSVP